LGGRTSRKLVIERRMARLRERAKLTDSRFIFFWQNLSNARFLVTFNSVEI